MTITIKYLSHCKNGCIIKMTNMVESVIFEILLAK
jgi:hypothetical protein